MKNILIKITFLTISVLLMGAGCFSLGQEKEPLTSGPGGMFVSIDKGDTWRAISLLPQAEGVQNLSSVSVYKLIEDPQDAKALYWASRTNGLFYSYNDGKYWQRPEDTLNTGFVYSAAVHPQDKCTIFATDGVRIFKSTDCNRSWEEVFRESRDNVKVNAISIDVAEPYRVYVIESNGDLLGSLDFGVSWSTLYRFKKAMGEIFCDPKQGGLIYVASKSNGLYRSEDGGNTWVNIYDQFKSFSGGLVYRRFVLHPKNVNKLYWISTYGILFSEDRGETWQAMNLITPPGSVNIYGFAVNGQNDKEIYYIATSQKKRSTFYRSVDGGVTWITKKMPSGQIPSVLRVHPKTENWIYLGFTIPPSE